MELCSIIGVELLSVTNVNSIKSLLKLEVTSVGKDMKLVSV
jgi:hypothetical protein